MGENFALITKIWKTAFPIIHLTIIAHHWSKTNKTIM